MKFLPLVLVLLATPVYADEPTQFADFTTKYDPKVQAACQLHYGRLPKEYPNFNNCIDESRGYRAVDEMLWDQVGPEAVHTCLTTPPIIGIIPNGNVLFEQLYESLFECLSAQASMQEPHHHM
jgi:hypothetical protein